MYTPESPDGRFMVMLHGGGQTRHSWRRSARRLCDGGWTVLVYDARGHGDSGWSSAADYHVEHLSVDLRSVLHQVRSAEPNLDTPVLVGASMGGMSCLLALGAEPTLARALILVDVVPRVEAKGVEKVRRFMRESRSGFATHAAVVDAVAAFKSHQPRPDNVNGLQRNVRRRSDGRLYWHWDPDFVSADNDAEALSAVLTKAASLVGIPTLVLRGELSDVVSEQGVIEFLSLVPSARAEIILGAGHMIAGDDNVAFIDSIEVFLSSLVR
nr:alpha/beta hydrolase [Rhodococcus sp. 15-1154-1]